MPRDKTENHEKIMAAAYDEFLEYGFTDASMRRIAAACGMSASGLYKHFPGKEEMFAALVEPAYSGLKKAYTGVVEAEIASVDESMKENLWNNTEETAWVMNYIYDHYSAFKLLVCKSQGTRYENYVHEFATMEEENTRRYMERLKAVGAEVMLLPAKELHMFATTCTNAIFLAVEHDLSRKKALEYAGHLDVFFEAGWRTLLRT